MHLGGNARRVACAGAGLGRNKRDGEHDDGDSNQATRQPWNGSRTVSAAVAALMEQTLKGLSMNAMKLVIILAAAGLIVTSAGTFAYQTAAKKTPTETGPQRKAYGKAYVQEEKRRKPG